MIDAWGMAGYWRTASNAKFSDCHAKNSATEILPKGRVVQKSKRILLFIMYTYIYIYVYRERERMLYHIILCYIIICRGERLGFQRVIFMVPGNSNYWDIYIYIYNTFIVR